MKQIVALAPLVAVLLLLGGCDADGPVTPDIVGDPQLAAAGGDKLAAPVVPANSMMG